MKIRPAMMVWTEVDICLDGGEVRRVRVMIPQGRFTAMCERQFDLNGAYALGPVDGVGGTSRAPLFIESEKAWENLPEEDTRFPSPEHIRHMALVKAGWAHHTQAIMDTPKDAKDHAKGLRKVAEYAVIVVKGCVVDCWIPKSIASGQITGAEWKVVKPKALDWIATLARTTRKELEENAGVTT